MSDRPRKPRSGRRTAALATAAVVSILALGCTAAPSEEEGVLAPAPAEAEAAVQPTADPAGSEEAPAAPKPARRALRVAEVVDGDTLDLDTGDRIRLVQIDAPEATGECYGRKAGSVLRRLLPVGTPVRVARDPGLDDIDRYGRLLRYVFSGRRNVNLLLVKGARRASGSSRATAAATRTRS
jgi:endonuclease YncB( thermonuclease family)